MALLTSAGTISIAGLASSAGVAATPAGDTFVNNGQVILQIINAHAAAARTITIASPKTCNEGSTHVKTVTVAALTTKYVYGFDVKRYNTTGDLVTLTYSDAAADLTVAIYQL